MVAKRGHEASQTDRLDGASVVADRLRASLEAEASSWERLVDVAVNGLTRARRIQLDRLVTMLDDPRLTGEARHDIDGQARLLARWLAQPSLEPPGEFRDSREAVVQVRRYARLLQAWPAVIAACRCLCADTLNWNAWLSRKYA